MLTADQILSTQDLKRKVVPVPKWGGDILLQELGGAAREELFIWLRSQDQTKDPGLVRGFRERVIVMSAINEDGEPLFALKDAYALGRKSNDVLTELSLAAQRLSGLLPEAVEETVDELPNAESPSAG
jgi:hypothetical protein